jgi:hypothetical protein
MKEGGREGRKKGRKEGEWCVHVYTGGSYTRWTRGGGEF